MLSLKHTALTEEKDAPTRTSREPLERIATCMQTILELEKVSRKLSLESHLGCSTIMFSTTFAVQKLPALARKKASPHF